MSAAFILYNYQAMRIFMTSDCHLKSRKVPSQVVCFTGSFYSFGDLGHCEEFVLKRRDGIILRPAAVGSGCCYSSLINAPGLSEVNCHKNIHQPQAILRPWSSFTALPNWNSHTNPATRSIRDRLSTHYWKDTL